VPVSIGVFEAKQKLSELIERAARGEEMVITSRGRERPRLLGMPPKPARSLNEVFDSLAQGAVEIAQGYDRQEAY
jgi:prevent-host-death family protein